MSDELWAMGYGHWSLDVRLCLKRRRIELYDGPPRPSLSTKRWFTTASEGHRTGFETKPRH